MNSPTSQTPRRIGRVRAASALAVAGAMVVSAGILSMIAAPASAHHDPDHNPPGLSNGTADNGNGNGSANANGHGANASNNGNGNANGHGANANNNGNRGNKPATPPGKTNHKSYVCKYVGTPGVDERLQTGQNPIWVDNHALGLRGPATNGQEFFNDRHGRSVVVLANSPRLAVEPSCPGPAPVTTIDVCPNLAGSQATVPSGRELVNGQCAEVLGEETVVPKPKPEADDEPTVKGVQAVRKPAAAPTAVAAGAGDAASSPLHSLAQLLLAGGLLLLVAAAGVGVGRRGSGSHLA